MQIGIRNTPFSMQICGFAICRLGHHENLRINHYNFADLRFFADWHTSEIYDLLLRNKPKNLQIFDSQSNNKNLRAHL
jgi:hypothetical protein